MRLPRCPLPQASGGVFIPARMDRIWWRDRTIAERHALGLASYNAGPGSILAAQSRCDDARFWLDIAPCLAAITGPVNARQTTDYVRKIGRWRMEIKGCLWRGHRGGCAPGGWI